MEYVNGTRVAQLDSPQATLSPSWQRLQVSYTATASGSNLYFTVKDSPAAASEAFNVDDMSACSGSAPPPNQAPNGTIDTPTANVTITAGQTVSFGGSGTDPDNNLPLTYAWNFGGGAANSTAQNPGAVTFAPAGTHTLSLTRREPLGRRDVRDRGSRHGDVHGEGRPRPRCPDAGHAHHHGEPGGRKPGAEREHRH